ncbi:putative aminopeptidase [Treponema primitia ZAS-2]|uniref:Putative aminopeptidase n=1 Tax=Treponema primitia (strain ATCC BAA-887 / DSM 12427 / ZAS-2) TaxID=545694 RepID=F5YNV7_TREPZ|nr:aminopeptidase [Treponema primitia]AEF85125.1 putative aminopeptidase [Treponema primitia ZAS-2]
MKINGSVLITFIPVLAAAGVLLGGSALFSGCYTLTQGSALLGYLGKAVPMKTLADSPDSADAEFARQVMDIRRFALEELGLRETTNYTKYVAIDRDYLAAVVSASAQDSFTRHEWWFPVVGSVPYKGFFNPEDARKERAKLEKKDLDVWVRGVDAFSTLGWFSDPLYSYMKEYPVHHLADLIIHESLHATIYLKNHSQFNEELAEFVGSEGARLYIEKIYGADSEEYRAITGSDGGREAFLSFIRELIAELGLLYDSGISREEKLQKKEAIILAAKARFNENYDTFFQNDNYRGFSELPINNAYLELYRLYYEEDRYFLDLYERSGRDLPAFITAVKTLKARGDPKAQLEQALGLMP